LVSGHACCWDYWFLTFLGNPIFDSFLGSALEFSLGAIFPIAFSALNVNQIVKFIFSFGAGMYANTGKSTNFLAIFLSWVSPLYYSCELLLRLLF
jgi:hypothetical protein